MLLQIDKSSRSRRSWLIVGGLAPAALTRALSGPRDDENRGVCREYLTTDSSFHQFFEQHVCGGDSGKSIISTDDWNRECAHRFIGVTLIYEWTSPKTRHGFRVPSEIVLTDSVEPLLILGCPIIVSISKLPEIRLPKSAIARKSFTGRRIGPAFAATDI